MENRLTRELNILSSKVTDRLMQQALYWCSSSHWIGS